MAVEALPDILSVGERQNSHNSEATSCDTLSEPPNLVAQKQVGLTRAASDSSELLRLRAKKTAEGFKRPAVWVLIFGWSLAVCAGLVNTVAYRAWGYYVSHVTGSSTAIGMRLEGFQQGRHEFYPLGEALVLLLSFLCGAFTCGLLIDKNQVHFGGKSFYGVALVGNAVLLVGAVCQDKPLSSAAFASAACGLQNAMCTSHFGAVVRTTHVTGTVTDIGSTLGRMAMIFLRKRCIRTRLNVLERAEVGVDARKLLVLLPMWFSFVGGTIAGAYLETKMGVGALLVPAGITFFIGAMYTFFRHPLKTQLKRLERDRLDQDLESMTKTLQRTQTFLHKLKQKRLQGKTMEVNNTSASQNNDFVTTVDEELGQMLEVVQKVEADLGDLCEADEEAHEHRLRDPSACNP